MENNLLNEKTLRTKAFTGSGSLDRSHSMIKKWNQYHNLTDIPFINE